MAEKASHFKAILDAFASFFLFFPSFFLFCVSRKKSENTKKKSSKSVSQNIAEGNITEGKVEDEGKKSKYT
jgi:hypothetical protein